MVENSTRFADARAKEGHFCHCRYSAEEGFVIEEYHHPMHRIFSKYPGMIAVELRMIEQTLGTEIGFFAHRFFAI